MYNTCQWVQVDTTGIPSVPVNLFSLQTCTHLLLALCRPLHKDKNSWRFFVWVGDGGLHIWKDS